MGSFLNFIHISMGFLDIILGVLLLYAAFKGLKAGLFATLASLVSLVLGIYIALKFSGFVAFWLQNKVSWSAKYVEITAFGITFLVVIIGIHLLAKVLDSLMDFAYLGWINHLAGGLFGVLRMVIILSILFNLFQKININNMIVKQETLNKSIFYNPIQEVSQWMYPKLENWYNSFKQKQQANPNQTINPQITY
jgi:membrane protein required for colicin V production